MSWTNLSHLWKFFSELGLGDDGSLITYIIAGVASYDGPYSRTKERIISMVKPHLHGHKTAEKMLLRLLKAVECCPKNSRAIGIATKVRSVIHSRPSPSGKNVNTPSSSCGTAWILPTLVVVTLKESPYLLTEQDINNVTTSQDTPCVSIPQCTHSHRRPRYDPPSIPSEDGE